MLGTRSDRGQVMVIVAIGLVALLGFTALAVDLGHAYGRRRAAQNACDAGAIAGARALADGESNEDVEKAAEDYAARNYPGLEPKHLAITINRDEHTVEVEATTDTGTFFARAIGVDTLPVHGQAKAKWFEGEVETVEGVGSVIPMIVKRLDGGAKFDPGTAYDMYEGTGAGQFGWLVFSGCHESCNKEASVVQGLTWPLQIPPVGTTCDKCAGNLKSSDIYKSPRPDPSQYDGPYDDVYYCSPETCPGPGGYSGPALAIGDWVAGGPGKMNSNEVRYALRNIILGYDPAESNEPDDDVPWPIHNPVVIPIYDADGAGGNGANAQYRVSGFAKFNMCCYQLAGGSSVHPCTEEKCSEAGPDGVDCSACVGRCSGNEPCVCGVFLEELNDSGSGGGTQRTYRDNVIKLIE